MSKRHLRSDPVCQNCGDMVQKRFCSNCGQENTETRQSFGHLLRHFIEDLTHYDGAFWLTLRYLLFRPAYLTKEFLKGHRSRFVPPVRLYIFISFITFFLPYVLPDFTEDANPHGALPTQHDSTVTQRDTTRHDTLNLASNVLDLNSGTAKVNRLYKSVRQLDSAQNALPEAERMGWLEYQLSKQTIHIQGYNKKELAEKFFNSFEHNFPKALFVYLPLFAFVLWLFHGKRRWLYFDHAIFTLHYFSFLLLTFNVIAITNCFFFIDPKVLISFQAFLFFFLFVALFIYFVMAHRRMYEESRLVSFIKAWLIYTINSIIFLVVLLAVALISIFTIH